MKKFTKQVRVFLAIMAMAVVPSSAMAQSKISVQNEDIFGTSNLQIITDANGSQIGILSKEYCYADEAGAINQFVYLPNAEGFVDFSTAYSLSTNKKYVFNTDGTAVSETIGDTFDGLFFDADGNVTYTAIENAGDVQFDAYMLKDERVIDAPENYALVKIGNQIWMRENLRATAYADGTSIPGDFEKEDWVALESGAYAVYNDENAPEFIKDDVLKKQGALYNWYAVSSEKALAPEGYVIPTVNDFMTLVNSMDPKQYNSNWQEDFSLSFTLGELLKSETGWQVPPSGTEADLQPGNNMSCLNIEPFGSTSTSKWFNGYSGIGRQAYLWTSTEYTGVEYKSMFIRFYWDSQTVNVFYDDMLMGYSVRCMTNNLEIKLEGIRSGISEVNDSGKSIIEVARYDANGNMIKTPVNGLNIIKYNDGSVKKIIL